MSKSEEPFIQNIKYVSSAGSQAPAGTAKSTAASGVTQAPGSTAAAITGTNLL
jgi:hypothetical protein